jgi:CO/xanthine dehydrogenase Mo-binding subunit
MSADRLEAGRVAKGGQDAGSGNADAAFAKADYTRRESFHCHRLTAVPLETRGLIAEWNADKSKLIVFGAAKVPFFNRRVLAPMLAMAEDAIDLIEVDVGGGFGVRGEFYPEDFLVALLAMRTRRPSSGRIRSSASISRILEKIPKAWIDTPRGGCDVGRLPEAGHAEGDAVPG